LTECLSSMMSADAREAFARPAGFRAECPLASGRDPSGEHLPSCLRIGYREPPLDLCSAGRRRTRLASVPPLKARPTAALSPRCGARRRRNAPALLSSETPWPQSNSPEGSLATPRMGYAVPLAGKSFSTQGDRRRRAPMTRHDWHRYWDANDGASWVPPVAPSPARRKDSKGAARCPSEQAEQAPARRFPRGRRLPAWRRCSSGLP
jgi:hypothetical protein